MLRLEAGGEIIPLELIRTVLKPVLIFMVTAIAVAGKSFVAMPLPILPKVGISSKKNLSLAAEVYNQGASTVFSYSMDLIRSGKILSLAN